MSRRWRRVVAGWAALTLAGGAFTLYLHERAGVATPAGPARERAPAPETDPASWPSATPGTNSTPGTDSGPALLVCAYWERS
ncbi:hypothetical protein [Streptomyces antarcticus]|uniref:hypothetical protein n=1 Tax=Streptomyces antarcticus TaxID=2996458 RepID=UPI002270F318|nr:MULTISPECIES: hypothetical protein [unclassified Streptomyces]MCY0943193.1 hypothetical protein [Streptomyces sp. H34-AA3]MCZ4085263.1 hypothetical protein [Streptomyces sp. H34-S5]